MSIKIKINDDAPAEEKRVPQETIKMKIRKTLGGDYIIHDHADINIVLKPSEKRIITFGKNDSTESDTVYSSQNRLFDFLLKKGVINHDSVEGGNIFGSMEATLQDSEEVSPIQVALYAISNFIKEERPYYMFRKSWEEDSLERYTNPSPDDSTELGEVPQARRKGSIDQWNTHAGRNARVYEGKERKNLKETSGIPKIKAPGINTRPETKGNYTTTDRQRELYKKQSGNDGLRPGVGGQYSRKADKFVVRQGRTEVTKYHEAIHAMFGDIRNNYGEGAHEFVATYLARKIGVKNIDRIASYLVFQGGDSYSYIGSPKDVWRSPQGLEECIATAYSILNDAKKRDAVFYRDRFPRSRVNDLKASWKKILKAAKKIDKDNLEIAQKIIPNIKSTRGYNGDFIVELYKNTESEKVKETIHMIVQSFQGFHTWMLDDLD